MSDATDTSGAMLQPDDLHIRHDHTYGRLQEEGGEDATYTAVSPSHHHKDSSSSSSFDLLLSTDACATIAVEDGTDTADPVTSFHVESNADSGVFITDMEKEQLMQMNTGSFIDFLGPDIECSGEPGYITLPFVTCAPAVSAYTCPNNEDDEDSRSADTHHLYPTTLSAAPGDASSHSPPPVANHTAISGDIADDYVESFGQMSDVLDHTDLIEDLLELDQQYPTSFVSSTDAPDNVTIPVCVERAASTEWVEDTTRERRRRKDGGGMLWRFLLDTLHDPAHNASCIRWEDEHTFRILDGDRLAELWGARRNRRATSFQNLARCIRHYYQQGLIASVPGKKMLYRFDRRARHLYSTLQEDDVHV